MLIQNREILKCYWMFRVGAHMGKRPLENLTGNEISLNRTTVTLSAPNWPLRANLGGQSWSANKAPGKHPDISDSHKDAQSVFARAQTTEILLVKQFRSRQMWTLPAAARYGANQLHGRPENECGHSAEDQNNLRRHYGTYSILVVVLVK